MNRINQLFASGRRDILSIYFCAGYLDPENTAEVIRALENNGVGMVEIGIPFSDPMADGPVIQNAAQQACRCENSSPNWTAFVPACRFRCC